MTSKNRDLRGEEFQSMIKSLLSKNFRGPFISICLGMIMIVGSQFFAYESVQQLASNNILLNKTTRILHQTASFGQSAKDLQLNMHGYLTTDNVALLEDNYTKRVQLVEISDTLFNLVKDDLSQTKRVKELLAVSSKMALYAHKVMSIYRIKGIDSTRNMIRKGDGTALNQLLMNKIHEIERYEELNLNNRRHLVSTTQKNTTLFITVTSIVGILLTLTAIIFLIRDQRKQQQMQLEINKKEGVLKQYVEAIPDGIMVINKEKEVVLLNQSGREMLGLQKGQFNTLSQLTDSINLVSPASNGVKIASESLPISRALHGEKLPGNMLNLLLEDKIKNLETSVSPIYEMDGEVSSAITVFRDITERVDYEASIERARFIAEKSLKVKDIFLSNVSHEIRTPLNAIIGFTNLLEGELVGTKNLEYVSYIQLAGKNLLDLINDILDFSKIEAGHVQLEKTAISLQELIDSVSVLITQRAREKGIRYEVNFSKNLPEIVQTDQLRLTQVLLNVCGNAVKFTDSGTVKLTVEPVSEIIDEHQTIRFRIEDTGIGIQEDKIKEIFERFVQASDSTTRLFGGTGLGLSIVKSLVTLLGGTVEVKSVVKKGTSFIIQCPFKILDRAAYEHADKLDSSITHELPKLRILVAEDNLLNQKLLQAIFERYKLEFNIVNNGLEAIQALGDSVYDLIIMDLQMPIMDGYTAIKKIRSSISTTIPIITMTAHALVGEKEECLNIGATSYISKPFKQKELLSTIWQVTLGKHAKQEIENLQLPEVSVPQQPNAVLNLNYLDEITGGSVEFRDELISMFEKDGLVQLSMIVDATNTKNAENLIQSIHKFRSSLFSVGLLSTADKFKIIEGNLKNKIWSENLENTISELEKEALTGLSELQTLKQYIA